MLPPNLIVKLKRAVIAGMAIALAITSSILFMKKSPQQEHVAAKGNGIIANSGKIAAAPNQPASASDHLASVAVIILNNGKELPLAIKVGDKYIKIPGPSSWPDGGATGSEKGRFLAGIVDTADVLRANGIKPDDTYSFVVSGTALNASNTFRVVGNHQQELARNNMDGYTEEYHSSPDEQGIWRSLIFKNIVLSYGQVPSLSDFLVAPLLSSTKNPIPNQTNTSGKAANATGTSTLIYQSPSEMAANAIQIEEATKKFREAMNNSNPAIRAQGIQNLVLYGDQQAMDQSQPGIMSDIEKGLTDQDPTVREATLGSLDLWDGTVPMQMLSQVALNDQNPELRMHALRLLVDRFEQQAVPTLQQASHDPDSRVAQKAVQLLNAYSP
jgi:HEAT repeats